MGHRRRWLTPVVESEAPACLQPASARAEGGAASRAHTAAIQSTCCIPGLILKLESSEKCSHHYCHLDATLGTPHEAD